VFLKQLFLTLQLFTKVTGIGSADQINQMAPKKAAEPWKRLWAVFLAPKISFFLRN